MNHHHHLLWDKNDEITAITVLGSTVICSLLNTSMEVSYSYYSVRLYSHMLTVKHIHGSKLQLLLQLADSSKSQNSIDVLVGSDYYNCDFITGVRSYSQMCNKRWHYCVKSDTEHLHLYIFEIKARVNCSSIQSWVRVFVCFLIYYVLAAFSLFITSKFYYFITCFMKYL